MFVLLSAVASILIIAAAIVFGLVVAAIRREDRDFTLAGPARPGAESLARRITGLHVAEVPAGPLFAARLALTPARPARPARAARPPRPVRPARPHRPHWAPPRRPRTL